MSDSIFDPKKEIKDFAHRMNLKYQNGILDQSVSIFIPFPEKEPLKNLNLSKEALEFIKMYEPKAKESGLFKHQYDLLNSYCNGAENFILTSSTGTGKSLCFWAWIIDHLIKNPKATALVCFPTQALMWGQADRLARVSSVLKSYNENCKNLSGIIDIGNQEIKWTVWKGVGSGRTKDTCMREHQDSPEFDEARIRVATLDKAHWSLIRDVNFTKNLECLVLDEAHIYDGVFGANVHYFLKRIYLAKEMAYKELPKLFLSSATLSNAREFASKLTSIKEEEIYHQSDSNAPQITAFPIEKIEDVLNNPPQNGLFRVNIFVDALENKFNLTDILSDSHFLGKYLNVLYFSNSKFESRMLNLNLKKDKERKKEIYDADLTPNNRRRIESLFNSDGAVGYSLIATNALELGVDIENLELCFINDVPSKRVDLIQRIGRVGRRAGIPGLSVLRLSAAPLDRFIVENSEEAFSFNNAKTIPLPLDLDIIKLRHLAAAHYGGCYRLYKEYNAKSEYTRYSHLLKKHFGIFLDHKEVKNEILSKYSGLINISDRSWVYKGFRASASEGKIPLIDIETKEDVAWIEDINVFRDAHPEAVYLDATGKRWRVVDYDGKWKIAKWEHPESDAILGKFLKSIDCVYLAPEKEPVVTRGESKERFDPYRLHPELPEDFKEPFAGSLEYGVWEYEKKFNGYTEINLKTMKKEKVGLKAIAERFKKAMNSNEKFPFLFPLSYRTYGWLWEFNELKKDLDESLIDAENLISGIISAYVADAVQSNPSDILCGISLKDCNMWVLDSNPGGNGLSEAVLKNDNLKNALERCIDTLESYNEKGMKKKFEQYILELCQEEVNYEPKQIIPIIQRIKDLWTGEDSSILESRFISSQKQRYNSRAMD